jgi:hypothetical protein
MATPRASPKSKPMFVRPVRQDVVAVDALRPLMIALLV